MAVFDVPTGKGMAMLIGRAGAHIEELRAESKCVIWTPDRRDVDPDAKAQRVEVAGRGACLHA